jgi:signal transduction histidine kinase
VAIPLVAMVGLVAYVTGASVANAINLDRGPNLINATSLPAAEFVNYLQSERRAAVVYLFQPTPANLKAYDNAAGLTDKNEAAFTAAMTSPATVSSETPSEAKAISAVVGDLSQLRTLRAGVKARALTPLAALGLYSQGIATEPQLFLSEAESETDATAVAQAIGLIATAQAREQLSQEDALLAGVLAGNRMTQNDRFAFTEMAAGRRAGLQYAQSILTPANLAIYNASQTGSAAAQQNLTGIEQAVAGGATVGQLPTTAAQWRGTGSALLRAYYNGGVALAHAVLVADHQISHAAWVRVAVTSGIALLGLLLTILVTTLVARGIIRRLRGLETSALTLAENQLPDVIARLRRGEDVDVAKEAPPLRVGPGEISRDEIGRVGQSFDLVRQTAIRAAVEEARLRRGLNDVFRSLARRSQSLLHRQLTLLDQMERRATNPEALDDLFRLDHLTTRMRRHAEGLVILAGAPPGRGWSSPVRMIDVMRGAIAEVEDYARVSVATRSQAALSGSAVADVIHLLAELIENATTLSPPYTSVRVSGDTVANGFAIEVEDRGLGMSPQRLAELNDRLANPPEFNPSDTEQLGLFVVGQLAKRHGIRVTLKTSPFGGTAAIVLVPRHLVVTEEAFRTGLPGEPAAITTMHVPANGNHTAAAGVAGRADQLGPGVPEVRGVPGLGQAAGIRISGPLRRSQGTVPDSPGRGAHHAPALGPRNGRAGPEPDELPRRHHDQPAGGDSAGQRPNGPDAAPNRSTEPAFDVFMPRRHGQETGETLPPADAGPDSGPAVTGSGQTTPASGSSAPYPGSGSYIASPPYPGPGSAPYPGPGTAPHQGPGTAPHQGPGTAPHQGPGTAPYQGPGAAAFPGAGSAPLPGPGPASFPGPSSGPYPGAGFTPYSDQPTPFPGWTGHNTAGASSDRGVPGSGAPVPPTPMTPVASPRPGNASGPPWELSRQTGPLAEAPGGSDPGSPAAKPDANDDIKGLPRRVKQANLAPQLRASPPSRRTTPGGGAGPSSGPTPAEIRQTMSALQRGWQEGRSQRAPGPSSDEPPREPLTQAGPSAAASASSGPDADPGAGAVHDSTADEEARGARDGT